MTTQEFWKPALNSTSVIVFLPTKDTNPNCFVKVKCAFFRNKLNGKRFFERTPNTIGLPCPMYEKMKDQKTYHELTGEWSEIGITSRYIANILVLSDAENHENDGKVFKFEFSNSLLNSVNKNGYNPVIIKKEPYQQNYFQVTISSTNFQCNLKDAIHKSYDLNEELHQSKFKSYEELKDLFNTVY